MTGYRWGRICLLRNLEGNVWTYPGQHVSQQPNHQKIGHPLMHPNRSQSRPLEAPCRTPNICSRYPLSINQRLGSKIVLRSNPQLGLQRAECGSHHDWVHPWQISPNFNTQLSNNHIIHLTTGTYHIMVPQLNSPRLWTPQTPSHRRASRDSNKSLGLYYNM